MAGPTWARTDYALCLVPSGLLAAEFIDWCSLLPSSLPSHTHSTHAHVTTTATHHHDHPPPPTHTPNQPTPPPPLCLAAWSLFWVCLGTLVVLLLRLPIVPCVVGIAAPLQLQGFPWNLGDGSVANRVFLDRLVDGGFWGPVDLPLSGRRDDPPRVCGRRFTGKNSSRSHGGKGGRRACLRSEGHGLSFRTFKRLPGGQLFPSSWSGL